MALSPWTKLNPTVDYCDTTKKFFGKFLFKAVVYLPGGNLIRNTKFEDMQFLLDERLSWHGRSYNYGGSWVNAITGSYARRKFLEDAKTEQLEYWRDTVKQNQTDFKFRVEEPHITVYSNDESALYSLVANDPRPKSIRQIFKPKNHNALEALDRGEIILKKKTEYTYRVCFREGKFDTYVVKSIGQLLMNQGDDVKLTNSCKTNLENTRYWFTRTYFYTKNLDIVTMINLISPDIVSGIFRVVTIPE